MIAIINRNFGTTANSVPVRLVSLLHSTIKVGCLRPRSALGFANERDGTESGKCQLGNLRLMLNASWPVPKLRV